MARQLRFDLGSHFFLGDNLDILRTYVAEETVDLIYLDPPFNSNRSYNRIFKHIDGTPVAAQIKAFDDTWGWNDQSSLTFRRTIQQGGDISRVLLAFEQILGHSDMLAYLTMMAPRLVELARVLKPSGSIYLHCDPTASHYLKLLMDATFGPANFQNEIIWKRSDAKGDATGQGARHFGRVNDSILFYTKGSHSTFNPMFGPLDPDYVKTWYRSSDPDGRRYKLDNMTGPGGAAKGNPYYEVMGVSRYWRYSKKRMQQLIDEGRVLQTNPGTVPMYKRYLDESKGTPITSNWADISFVRGHANEKLGYPTQKPLALLERIIQASSNPGDVVLDPFCGCGTAIDAAQRLGRRWVGIDITRVALDVITDRLANRNIDYTVTIVPPTIEEAELLAERDKYGFQQWISDRLGIEADIHKGADRGIDGELVRYDLAGRVWRAVISVKGGGVNVTQVRDLVGTVQRERADVGIFVTLKAPTKPMRQEALDAGLTDDDIPKIQILTVADLFDGKMPVVPHPEALVLRPIELDGKIERRSAEPTLRQGTRQVS
jgi:DNA modification methylase